MCACSRAADTIALTACGDSAARRLEAKSFLIDGELVCCRDDGVTDFERLRSRRDDGVATLTALSPRAQAADQAAREDAARVITEWNERIVEGRPMWSSPSPRAAIVAGYTWLDVFCPACQTSREGLYGLDAAHVALTRPAAAKRAHHLPPRLRLLKTRERAESNLARLVGGVIKRGNWRQTCDGSTPVLRRSPVLSANACVPSQTPADGSAGMTDGGSGYADTINSGPARPAAVSDLRNHSVRLRDWRGRHCMRRSCDGQGEASNSNQPDHCLLHSASSHFHHGVPADRQHQTS